MVLCLFLFYMDDHYIRKYSSIFVSVIRVSNSCVWSPGPTDPNLGLSLSNDLLIGPYQKSSRFSSTIVMECPNI